MTKQRLTRRRLMGAAGVPGTGLGIGPHAGAAVGNRILPFAEAVVAALRKHRASIFYGANQVRRDGEIIPWIERRTGRRVLVVVAGAQPRLSPAPQRIVIPAAGT